MSGSSWTSFDTISDDILLTSGDRRDGVGIERFASMSLGLYGRSALLWVLGTSELFLLLSDSRDGLGVQLGLIGRCHSDGCDEGSCGTGGLQGCD